MGVLMEPIEKHGAGDLVQDLVCACYNAADRRSTSPSDRHCISYVSSCLRVVFIISVHPRLGVRCSEERAVSTLIAIEFQIELMELALQG
jgi:hypothetical protein